MASSKKKKTTNAKRGPSKAPVALDATMDVNPNWLTEEEEPAEPTMKLRRQDGVKIVAPALPSNERARSKRQALSATMDVSPHFPDEERDVLPSGPPPDLDALVQGIKKPQKLLLMGLDGNPITVPSASARPPIDPRASLSTTMEVSPDWLDDSDGEAAPAPGLAKASKKSSAPPRKSRGQGPPPLPPARRSTRSSG